MNLQTYIKEIKYRCFYVMFCFFSSFIVLYYYKEELLFLVSFIQENVYPYFISTKLTEIFFVFIKYSLFFAVYFSYPVLLLQCWLFLIPALYSSEYKKIQILVYTSILIYLMSTITSYFLLLPLCWKFFYGYQLSADKSFVSIFLENKINDFFQFFFEIFISLNFLLHLFLICFLLVQKYSINRLIYYRKCIYFILFFLATIITPPDIISQLIVGLSFLISYECFLFLTFLQKEYTRVNNGS